MLLSRRGIHLATSTSMQLWMAATLPWVLSGGCGHVALAQTLPPPKKRLPGLCPLAPHPPLLGSSFDAVSLCFAGSSFSSSGYSFQGGRGQKASAGVGDGRQAVEAFGASRPLQARGMMPGPGKAEGEGVNEILREEARGGGLLPARGSIDAEVRAVEARGGEVASEEHRKALASAAMGGQEDVCEEDQVDEEEEERERVADGTYWFKLTDSTRLCLSRGDLTKWSVDSKTDAIVNAANERMLGGGGVDGAIHRAAGHGLYEECVRVPEVEPGVRCPTGKAVVTGGHKLPAARVVHTVGPMYWKPMPQELLAASYRNSLLEAAKVGVKYVAFPAISCGVYGYPYRAASEMALLTVKETLENNPTGILEVHFVLFEQPAWDAWLRTARESLRPTSKRART